VGAGYGRRMAKEGGSRLVGCAAGERWQRPCGGRGRHAGVGWGVRLGGPATGPAALGQPNVNSLIFDLFKPF
jgi:hypothetical protein